MSNPNPNPNEQQLQQQTKVVIKCWYCGVTLAEGSSDLANPEIDQHFADNPTHGTQLRVDRVNLQGLTGRPASVSVATSNPNDPGYQQVANTTTAQSTGVSQ